MNDNLSIYQQLNIIFAALLGGMVMFFVVVFFLIPPIVAPENADAFKIFNFLTPLVVLLLIPAGYFIYNTLMKKAHHLTDEAEKWTIYRTAVIARLAVFEGAAFFSLVTYMLSSNQQNLLFFAIVLIVFFINKPSEARFAEDSEPKKKGLD